MRTVLEKLRMGGSEEVEGREYKAAKALVVVFPLLGVTYILTLVGPSHNLHPLSHQIFQTVRVSLLSTQVSLEGLVLGFILFFKVRSNSHPVTGRVRL